jgi:hypothetical protein
MTNSDQAKLYEKQLGSLEGTEFEEEFCFRMQTLVSDFQRIPAKPQGDGGLDGLSHNQQTAYCCYGPEQTPDKSKKTGALKEAIVKKFKGDLRRIFELETYGRGRLRDAPNSQLEAIMGEGKRILTVYLVVSWFESHRLIGPLNTAFSRFKQASNCRFVDPDATLTIWGPKDLASRGSLDEHTIFRMENRMLFDEMRKADANGLPDGAAGDFDAKFGYLKRRRPERSEQIDLLAKDFRSSWAAAVALDNHLAATSVALHESLEITRRDAATSARLKSMGSDEAPELIEAVREEVLDRLSGNLGQRLGVMATRVADGLVAGLIGECPLDWRSEVDD